MTAASPDRRARLNGFDGLRACAALSIVAYHSVWAAGATQSGLLAPLLSELKAGVAVFFVISGFLLYLPYARSLGNSTPLPDWRDYVRRRAVRIVPAYWVALTVLAAGPLAASIATPDWWRFYGLTQIYRSDLIFSGLGVAWSLCVEVSFYALLPAFAWVLSRGLRRPRRRPVRVQLCVLGVLAIASSVLRAKLAGSVVAPVVHGLSWATALPGMLDWFALGMALAVFRSESEAGRNRWPWLTALAQRPGWCWGAAATLYCAGVPTQHGDVVLPAYGLVTHLAIGLAAAAFILPAAAVPAATDRGRRRGVLSLLWHPLVAWIGTVSYGVYLWHKPVLTHVCDLLGVTRTHPSLLAAAAVFLATGIGAIAFGAASYYLIERPAQRRLRPVARPLAATAG
jgi:peptidoglycan/LPS O-acetylase OafA/YrhL